MAWGGLFRDSTGAWLGGYAGWRRQCFTGRVKWCPSSWLTSGLEAGKQKGSS